MSPEQTSEMSSEERVREAMIEQLECKGMTDVGSQTPSINKNEIREGSKMAEE